MTEQKMSTGKTIFWIGFTIFWIIIAGYTAWTIYRDQVLGPQKDALYESYGCYISDGGSMYTCPNGLPPGEEAAQ